MPQKKPKQIQQVIVTCGREGYQVNDLQIPGSTNVSRRHCLIVNCRDDVWLYDLESTGTHVNGERVSGKLPLVGRNAILVGSNEFIITTDEDSLL